MKASNRALAALLGLAIGLGAVPAFADRHDHGDRDHWARERWERDHRYYAPPVVVAPPPGAYYVPPPVVMAPPSGLNIILPIHIR